MVVRLVVDYNGLKDAKTILGLTSKYYFQKEPGVFVAIVINKDFSYFFYYIDTEKPNSYNTDFPGAVEVQAISF